MPVSTALIFEDLLLPAAEFSDPAAPEYRLCQVLRGEAELSWAGIEFANPPAFLIVRGIRVHDFRHCKQLVNPNG